MRLSPHVLYCALLLWLSVAAHAEEFSIVPTDTKQRTLLYRQSHALVIGIDGYSGGWPKLGQARNDAVAIAAELARHGFAVMMKTDADMMLDKAAIERLIDDFVYGPGTQQDARLLIWFAGHGHTIDGEGYIVPQDAPHPATGPPERRPLVEAQFRRSALSLRRFGEYMRETKAKHVLAIFDSCFGGTVFDATRSSTGFDVTAAAAANKVRQFVSSGDAEQEVSDDGLFRKLFIDAIDGTVPEADENQDGLLTATELGRFLTYKVTSYKKTAQTPRYGRLRERDLDRGEFVFRVRPTRIAAPPPTADVPEPPFARRGAASSIYFITDRKRDANPGMVGFTGDRGEKLTLGKAIVRAPSPAQPALTFDGLSIIEPEEFLAGLPAELARSEKFKGHVLVYLHGFNVSFDHAFQSTAQLALDIGFDAPMFVYSWPSIGAVTGYMGDMERADKAGLLFARFIDWLVRRSEVETVNVIAHSVGGKILLNAVSRWRVSDEFIKQKLGHFIFIAPDIDRGLFSNAIASRNGIGKSVTLYVSANDKALLMASMLHGSPRAGDSSKGRPLVLQDVHTIDISSIGTDFFSVGHSPGIDSKLVLSDMSLILQGKTEPNNRLPVFERVQTPAGPYWRWR